MVSLAKQLRAQALERINSSPDLTAAYRRRNRWPDAVRRIVAPIAFAVLAPFAAYPAAGCLVAFVLAGGVFSLGPLVMRDCDDRPFKDIPIFPGSALATHGWLAAAILAIAIATVRGELFFPKSSLRSLAYAPHDDRQAFGIGERCYFWIAIGLVMCWQAVVLGWVARHEQATALQWALIGPLAVFQTAVVYSLLLATITLLRAEKRINEATGHVLPYLFYGYVALLLIQFFPQWTPAIARQLLTLVGWLLPTGWIDALYWHGVLGGRAWSWLLLLACAAVIAAGIVSRRWPLLLREIRISPQGEFTPIFADDPEPDESNPLTIHPPRNELTAAPRPLVLKRLLDQTLGGGDWSDGWFVERWIGSRLSQRERAIAECLVGELPNWTVGWYLGLAILAALTAVVLGLSFGARSEEDRLALSMLQKVLCLGALFSSAPRACRRSQRPSTPLPLLPLGFREVLATSLKVATYRLALWLPILAVVLLLMGLRLGRPGELLMAGLATAIGATLTLAFLDPVFRFGSRTRYEFSLHRCAFLLLIGLLAISAPALLAIPFWPLTMTIAAGLPALALLGAIHYDWLHRTGRIDYRTELPAQSSRGRESLAKGGFR